MLTKSLNSHHPVLSYEVFKTAGRSSSFFCCSATAQSVVSSLRLSWAVQPALPKTCVSENVCWYSTFTSVLTISTHRFSKPGFEKVCWYSTFTTVVAISTQVWNTLKTCVFERCVDIDSASIFVLLFTLIVTFLLDTPLFTKKGDVVRPKQRSTPGIGRGDLIIAEGKVAQCTLKRRREWSKRWSRRTYSNCNNWEYTVRIFVCRILGEFEESLGCYLEYAARTIYDRFQQVSRVDDAWDWSDGARDPSGGQEPTTTPTPTSYT